MQIIQVAITIVLFILILGALIVIHEFGHFLTARLFGMRVHEFAIGMGPLARTLRNKGETLYTLRWLPIGGYVRLEGEDGDSEDPRSFTVSRLWKQVTVLVAGVFMNLVLAVAIFIVVGLFAPVMGVRFQEVEPGSPAAAAGLRPGDAIYAVNGQQSLQGDVLSAIRAHPGEKVILGIDRGGQRLDVPVSLRPSSQIDADHGPLGISGKTTPFEVAELGSRNPAESVTIGFQETGRAFGLVLDGLGKLISSVATNPTTAPPVSGPIGIASIVGQVFWQAGPLWTLYLMGILSANLALMNVLPFPPLDGGRVFVIVLKAILGRGRRLLGRAGVTAGPSAQTAVTAERLTYLVGFVFLFGLIIWISVFDVIRLGSGGATP